FTFGMNDLGATFALGFGLAGDGSDHGFVDVDILDFHVGNLDAPRVGGFVQRFLKDLVDVVAFGEDFIQLMLTEYRAQTGLCQLAGCLVEVRYLQHRFVRVDDAEIHHGVDVDGHVVIRDHVLRRHVHHVDAQIHANDALQHRYQQDQTGAFGTGVATQRQHHATLVFRQNLDGRKQEKDDESDDDADETVHDVFPL